MKQHKMLLWSMVDNLLAKVLTEGWYHVPSRLENRVEDAFCCLFGIVYFFFFFSRVLRDSTPRFVGPSVCPSVGPLVRWSIRPSVRPTHFTFF